MCCTAHSSTQYEKPAPGSSAQVQLLLRKVRPEWTTETFQTVPFTTHGDQQMEGALRDLGQGAFTGEQQLITPAWHAN